MTAETKRISYTLVADGPRDLSVLPDIIQWVIRRVAAHSLQVNRQLADFRQDRNPPKTLSHRIQEAVRRYPCDILFIHRDAESSPRKDRVTEIAKAVSEAGIGQDRVPVVPVQMTETWLLISESAIRKAAGNPNGRNPMVLPRVNDLETLPDAKNMLHNLLKEASDYQGRKRKAFMRDINHRVHRVGNYIDDYSPLESLSAFRAFQADTKAALKRMAR